jgi:hypothetical protein
MAGSPIFIGGTWTESAFVPGGFEGLKQEAPVIAAG